MGLRKSQLYAIVASAFIVSCGSPQVLETGGKRSSDTQGASPHGPASFPVAELKRPKFDASTLEVTDLTIAKEHLDPNSEFSASRGNVNIYTSGMADYVELTTVFFSEDGSRTTEVENVVTTRHPLKLYGKGKITVLARACVSEERALDVKKNCGDTRMAVFRSTNVNEALLVAERRLAEKTAELQEWSLRAVAAIAKATADQLQCEAKGEEALFYKSLFALAQNLLSTGDVMVSEFFKPSDYLTGFVDPRLMTLIPELEYEKLAASLDSIVKGLDGNYKPQLTAVAQSIPLFKNSADPLQAMVSFGGGLFDLLTANITELAECYVPEIEGIETHIESLKAEVAALKTERDNLGGAQ